MKTDLFNDDDSALWRDCYINQVFEPTTQAALLFRISLVPAYASYSFFYLLLRV